MKKTNFAELYTHEGENLHDVPWNTYPRPMMKRDSFINLNGEWDFCTSENEDIPEIFNEKIVVPFPPQSLLSKIHRNIPENEYLFYRRNFVFSEEMKGKKILLHIGAADQYADIWLNGKFLGKHSGGYEHFSFDITEYLCEKNTLIIRVIDKMSTGVLPFGKQRAKRGGMWYTPVSGIWQTVWMECVPENYISDVSFKTGFDFAEISVFGGSSDINASIETPEGNVYLKLKDGFGKISFKNPRMWSPEDPYLYRCVITSGEDIIESYFALRVLETKIINGVPRLCLNGKPYFFHGLLDQGYWSDGIFTPADASCYEKDILATKSFGFNTLRKHIKIEPEQFYYDCDRLGIVVLQDMINNDDYNFFRDTALPNIGSKHIKDSFLHKNIEKRTAFLDSMKKTVLMLKNHPCICYWTIFNEGWGQFESEKAYYMLKELDSSRFVGSVSGWFQCGESDVSSEHCYFKRFKTYKSEKPLVLTEFGGYSFAPEGHIFNPDNEYGYKKYSSREKLADGIIKLYERDIIPAVKKGLCAAIYTQLSDVEDETNGFLSYDRKIMKILPEEFIPVSEKLYEQIK